MADSGLPCYGRGAPVENLRKRFRLDLTDAQAADFMRQNIADAYDKVRLVPWGLGSALQAPGSMQETGALAAAEGRQP